MEQHRRRYYRQKHRTNYRIKQEGLPLINNLSYLYLIKAIILYFEEKWY